MSIANNFSIGNRYDGASQAASDFVGNVSEVIIYNNPINLAQRIIVENYLAAKYGLTINNDLYDYQGIFFYDVVGIGSTASEGQHLEAMSDSLLLVSNPVALDSGEFVFMGHDNGSKSTWTTFEAPLSGSNVRRIAREWRVDIVGDPGDFSFKVDVSQLPTPENGFTQYAIYVDADGDFNNGSDIYQLDFSPTSGLYVTDQISINEGDYITIGVLKPVIEFTLVASDSTESFTNPKIEVQGKEVLNKNYTIVNSLLIATSERPEVKIDWRVYTKNPENPLIRDLIIEGLSLARTQKEEFASILNSNNGDIKVLFETLKIFAEN